MSSFLDRLTSVFQGRFKQKQDRSFLEAAMAACAMVSASEGQVAFCDRIRVDQIMETLTELKVFDPHEGVDLFNHFTDRILQSPKLGREEALKSIRAVASDKETAEILIDVCLAVSLSDGKTSLIEHIEIVSLCGLIGLDSDNFGLDTEAVLARFVAED